MEVWGLAGGRGMKVSVEELSPIRRVLSVEVGAEQVQPKLEEAYREWGQQASIPGFRKGKIPRSVLQLHFGKQIEDKVIKEVVSEAYGEAIKGENIRVAGLPEVDEVRLEPDQTLHFRATVETKPDLQVKDYLEIEVLRRPVEAKEEEVEQALKALQDRTSQFVPMEGWPALEGDLVYVDIQGLINKKAIKELSRDNYPVLLGSRVLLPELEMALLNMQKDEWKELEVALPVNFIQRNLAGRRAVFRLRVNEIKKKKVPELNDEFPKEIGEEGTLDDLREKIKKELLREKEREQDDSLKDEILDKIAEASPCEVPPSLMEEELNRMVDRTVQSLAARQASLKDLDLDEESLRERFREQARQRVRNSLILEAIAMKEQVEPTEEEIQKEVEEMALPLKQNPETLRRYLEKDGLAEVKRVLRERKTLDFLFEHARIISGDRIVLA